LAIFGAVKPHFKAIAVKVGVTEVKFDLRTRDTLHRA